MEEHDVLDAADAALSVMFEDSYEPVERDVPQAEAPERDTPEAPTIDDSGRPRGPDGRFVSLEETNEQVPTPPEAEEPEEVAAESDPGDEQPEDEPDYLEIDDPEILDYLDKYDGDIVQALRAAREAQTLIGRQGSELGDARTELEELRQMLTDFQSSMNQRQQAQSIDWETLIEEDPARATQAAIELQAGQRIVEEAYAAWESENPFAARMFITQLNSAMQSIDEGVRQPQQSNDISREMEQLSERYPDLRESLPAIEKLAAERPIMRQALYEGDSRSRAQALEDLYQLAKSRAVPDTSKARKVYLRAKQEADAAKADAAVVGASKASQATSPPPPDPNSALRDVLAGVFDDETFVIE